MTTPLTSNSATESLERWSKGDPLTADKLNAPVDAINRTVRGVNPPRQLNPAVPPSGAVQQFKLKSLLGDYFIGHTWNGTEEGQDDVAIAKPLELRKSFYDGLTKNGVKYTDLGDQLRNVKILDSDSEGLLTTGDVTTEGIVPRYEIDGVLYATQKPKGGTGVTLEVPPGSGELGEEVNYLDDNRDARQWQKLPQDFTRQLRFKTMDADHIVCRSWNGTQEGDSDLIVAKPYLLRNTPFDGLEYNGLQVSSRPNHKDRRLGEEPQSVYPPYVVNDVLFGTRNVTQATGVPFATYVDDNRDGRGWVGRPIHRCVIEGFATGVGQIFGYLTCRLLFGPSQASGSQINVAYPKLLYPLFSTNASDSRNGYTASVGAVRGERIRKAVGPPGGANGDMFIEMVSPSYEIGDRIYAAYLEPEETGIYTGLQESGELRWIDINVDGRAWRKKTGDLHRFRFLSSEGDVWIGRLSSGIADLNLTNVPIAKTHRLRRTPFHGRVIDGFQYTYTTDYTRQVLRVSDNSIETQVIIPSLRSGSYPEADTFLCSRDLANGTPLTYAGNPVVWQDMNVDGRAWARALSQ